MSIEYLLGKFKSEIRNETPKVIALKGKWGTGKTYIWKEFIHNISDDSSEQENKFEEYSYISLFGISDLENFRSTIFDNKVSIKRSSGDKNNFQENIEALFEKCKDSKLLRIVKKNDYIRSFVGSSLDSWAFSSINRILICIDDLERRGKNLHIDDVLGLISYLKEERNCKIILIMNDEKIVEDDFKRLYEKVVDIHYEINPSPEECAKIIFDSSFYANNAIIESVKKLGITNIRLLKKVKSLIENVLSTISHIDSRVYERISSSIILFSWGFFCSESDPYIPNISRIKEIIRGVNDDDVDEMIDVSQQQVIGKYGIKQIYGIDDLMISYILTGFYDKEKLNNEIELLQERFKFMVGEEEYLNAIRRYRFSFDDNKEEIVNTIFSHFNNNLELIGSDDFHTIYKTLKELNEMNKANIVLEKYIEINISKGKFKEDFNPFDDYENEIKKKFYSEIKKNKKKLTIQDILFELNNNKIEEHYLEILLNTTEEDLYKMFKSIEDVNGESLIRSCLSIRRFQSERKDIRDTFLGFYTKTVNVLRRIGKECEINKIRVSKYLDHQDDEKRSNSEEAS